MSATSGTWRGARELYFASPVYAWRLGGGPRAALGVPLNDDWPGDPEAGRDIVEGRFRCHDRPLQAGESPWSAGWSSAWSDPGAANGQEPEALAWLHGFAWLRDLRELGGEPARTRARDLVGRWIKAHGRWHPLIWRADIIGERLASWLGNYDLFCESADDRFVADCLQSLSRQARHLGNDPLSAPDGSARFRAIKGLTMAGVALGLGPVVAQQAKDWLDQEVSRQINDDGGHASRSPGIHVSVLRDLLDIRRALSAGPNGAGDRLSQIIERMADALRLWRHGDGRLALFNGAVELESAALDGVLKRIGTRRRKPKSLAATGFERAVAGRSCLIVDGGAPSAIDGVAHAAPLAFEFSVGKQRLIVNCGAAPEQRKWREPLRATAAHSALVLDDRNAADLGLVGSGGQRPSRVAIQRREEEANIWLQGEHDGYVATHGLVHRRRFYLSRDGAELRGSDDLVTMGDPGRPASTVTIRFHLHPRVRASLVQRGSAVLLRLATGSGWRFRSDGELALHDSVYFGQDGRHQRTRQIVITHALEAIRSSGELTIRWALRREDAGRPAL